MEKQSIRLKVQERGRVLQKAFWDDIMAAPKEGRPVCWSTMQTPAELLHALGFSVVYGENYGAACGASKKAAELCEIAENAGYSPDVCVYARSQLGYAISGKAELCPIGGIPKPDVLVCVNYCHAVQKWYEELSRIYNVPLVSFEFPFLHDRLTQEERSNVTSHVADQMRDAIPVLERVAHRKLDEAQFQRAIVTTADMVAVWNRIMRLAQLVPAPVSAFDLFYNLFAMTNFRGRTEGLTYLEELEAEINERIVQGVSAVPGEKYRLYWGGIPLWNKIGHIRRRFGEAGANFVSSVYLFFPSYDELDPARPFETSLPSIVIAGNRGVARQSDFLAGLVRDYRVDGVVWQVSRGCKVNGIGTYDWMDRFKREFGIPVMTIEADMCDDRSYQEARVETDIAAFLEMLSYTRARRLVQG